MSWLDNLFGGGAKKRDAQGTYDANRVILNSAQNNATGALSDARNMSVSDLARYYGLARMDLMGGQDRAVGAINQGAQSAAGAITDGYGRAINTSEDFLQRTQNVLNPYMEAGSRARDSYYNALGLNGADAQGDFYNNLSAEATNNPIYQQGLQQQQSALARQSAATGVGGGRLALAYARSAQDRGQQYMDNRLNALQGQSNLGGQFANTMAGYTAQAGDRIGGYQAGQGQALASNAQNQGGQLANTYSNFSNAMAGQNVGLGQNMANLNTGFGNNMANMYAQYAGMNAQNRSGLGNSYAATRGSGMQNIVNLAGAGISAYGAMNRPRMSGGF